MTLQNPELPDGDRWRSALHESAHAVTAHSLGVPVYFITLLPKGSGLVQHATTDAWTLAVIAEAGGRAESLADLHAPPADVGVAVADAGDLHRASAFVANLERSAANSLGDYAAWAAYVFQEPRERGVWMDRADEVLRAVSQILADHELAIVKVARELHVRRALTAPRIEELFEAEDVSMIEQLVSGLKAHEAKAAADFVALARRLASGSAKVTPAVIAETARVLQAAGRSPDDLDGLVRIMAHRNGLRVMVAEAERAETELRKIEGQLAKAEAALEAARRTHDETIEPLVARQREIRAVMTEARAAHRELENDCPDQALVAELLGVAAELEELRAREAVLQAERKRLDEVDADLAEAERREGDGSGKASYWRHRAEVDRRAGTEAKAALPDVERRIAELERREAEVRTAMRAA